MITNHGIATDAWAAIDGDCPISGELVGEEGQLELGVRTASLHLVCSESGLRNLVAVATEVLDEMDHART
ncbi:hypothetical protein CFN78_03220 [Amycolatopsis antarctica]|uniref:Uncharacterized protein n=1 Tax=Amycolatopsis antarctica TaxID=1854586 RepID=A0A263D9J4_9PSEU|nr:hypothetical protein [Amycolatopsis antarctica]OZM75184.1 hypothetical protein CFN78_03220 [Amycolatopsis antarctica]